jgi:hypothetical protein
MAAVPEGMRKIKAHRFKRWAFVFGGLTTIHCSIPIRLGLWCRVLLATQPFSQQAHCQDAAGKNDGDA